MTSATRPPYFTSTTLPTLPSSFANNFFYDAADYDSGLAEDNVFYSNLHSGENFGGWEKHERRRPKAVQERPQQRQQLHSQLWKRLGPQPVAEEPAAASGGGYQYYKPRRQESFLHQTY